MGQGTFDVYHGLAGKDEWLTPPRIIEKLGTFDLDPCAPINRPWATAEKHYTVDDNGLFMPWVGRVWCNPPYGGETASWLRKLREHGNGIALIFARTETGVWFSDIWGQADALLFLRGRLRFHHLDGTLAANSAGAPSCLIAYGSHNAKALHVSNLDGALIMGSGIKMGTKC